jgi:phytoene dehydrogenase-like protein
MALGLVRLDDVPPCDMMAPMIDVIVIGAGLGGLMAAAKLARRGRKVLLVEKKFLPGGTSYVFRRGGYSFPMGPLSFSFPGRVHDFLEEAGAAEMVSFRRNGFELRTPSLDVMMSQSLPDMESSLAGLFPEEKAGLGEFFRQLGEAISVSKDMDLWHPDFRPCQWSSDSGAGSGAEARATEVRRLSGIPAALLLGRLIANGPLRNFLGSMGTSPPEMSMLNLALMWNVMAEEGIWFPSCGVHGIADLLRRKVRDHGGEVRLSEPVRRIIVRDGRAAGVRTADGRAIESRWVISNADYKTTFLDLLDAADIPGVDLDSIRAVPYTDSELCVYLGIRPEEADLLAIHAEHLFFRKELREGRAADPEDFDNREIEICFWSRKAPDLAPAGRASLVLRANFPYGHFAAWRTGEKERKEGYREYKARLARGLIKTAETILPGLAGAVEVMEIATPLTYRDWGSRYEGSIAGWTWGPKPAGPLSRKILVQTPVPGLLAAGVYAAAELFLGGVPTALYTGCLAADYILGD